jgi:hypothetical protein
MIFPNDYSILNRLKIRCDYKGLTKIIGNNNNEEREFEELVWRDE